VAYITYYPKGSAMTTIEKQYAMPEWLTRKDVTGGAWLVQEGQPVRGDAWTQLLARRMRVPVGADTASRVVRAHEMMHAKVSPGLLYQDGRYGVTNESIIVAEEARVNHLVGRAGFDIDELADGSEHRSGEISGTNNDWNGAIRFLTAIVGTKAATAFIRGVRKNNAEMADSLNEFQKALKKEVKRLMGRKSTAVVGNTVPVSDWTRPEDAGSEVVSHPRGFGLAIALAAFVDRFLVSEGGDGSGDDVGDGDDGIPTVDEIEKMHKAEFGRFANLVEKDLPKPRRVDGKFGRRKAPSQIGRNPRRMERMLTDPEKRVFDRKIAGRGGVVLIDMSGSMHLSEKDLWALLEHAPGCVVIGYSHLPGSTTRPNVFVLADRGRVVDEIPSGNGGNGVDGPALRFAQAKRRSGEPFVWVCDGYVTDGEGDSYFANLGEECARFVKRHRVHMVGDVGEAVKALKRAADGQRLDVRLVGHLACLADR
jgi:hypothetical protein